MADPTRKKWKIVHRKNKKGEITKTVIEGRFRLPEMKIPSGHPSKRVTLCAIEEYHKKKLPNGVEKERTKEEKAAFLALLYNKKEDELRKKYSVVARSPMFSVLSRQWLEHIKAFRDPKTYIEYKNSVSLYLRAVGDHPISEFEVDYENHFLEFLKRQKVSVDSEKHYSPRTIKKHIGTIQTLFNWVYKKRRSAMPHGKIHLTAPTVENKEIPVYSRDELRKTQEWLEENLQSRKKALMYLTIYRAFLFCKYTLVRGGVVWSLKLEMIDLKNRTFSIRDNEELGWKNKKNKQVDKPIHPALAEFLEKDFVNRAPEEKYYLDNGQGKPYYSSMSKLTHSLSKILRKLEIYGKKPFHSIRAAGATYLLEHGEDLRNVQLLLDHESILTTTRYDNRRGTLQRKTIESLPE